MFIRSIASISIIIFTISSCSVTTHYGKTSLYIEDDIEFITIYWNTFSNENDIGTQLNNALNKTLKEKEFSDFEILYKSNENLNLGKRIYAIKYFKSSNNKKAFTTYSESNINDFEKLTSTVEFDNHLKKLKKGLNVKDVFLLLPELTKSYPIQIFLDKYSILDYSCIEFSFDEKGNLVTFSDKKNNN